MKKIFLVLAIAALSMVSCQNDSWNIFGRDNSVEVTLKVKPPQMQTLRSEASGLDSALGAIDNFNANEALWEAYDLRYILEIYEVVTSGVNKTTSERPIYKRQTKVADYYRDNSVDFTMQLVPNREYKFVIWADFVNALSLDDFISEVSAETDLDLCYETSNLRAISRTEEYAHVAMEEALDAYYTSTNVKVTGAMELPLTLNRPLAKLRVVAIDYDEIRSYSTPTQANVIFDTENYEVYNSFNAVDNKPFDRCEAHTYDYPIDATLYKEYEGKTTDNSSVTGLVLFSDYLFAQPEISEGEKNEQEVGFSMTITFDNDQSVTRTIDFDTQIPISRNYLTTIVGNCLTQQEGFVFNIDDHLPLYHEEIVE